MVNPDHMRKYIVRPTLQYLTMWSAAAENLLMGTIAVESTMGTNLVQLGGGPGRGWPQVEVDTHWDCWVNWLDYRPEIATRVLEFVPSMYRILDHDAGIPVDPMALVTCPMYAVAIARIKYRRVPEPLPAPTDWAALESYHKRYYNTAKGATKPGEFVAAARSAGLVDVREVLA